MEIGLTQAQASERLNEYGLNTLKSPQRGKGITLFLSQFKSPLILLLSGAAILSLFLGGHTDATIICIIIGLSGLLGFFQERGALNSLEKLMQIIENKIGVIRDGVEVEISTEKIVPGDLIILRAGDLIPADCTITEASHFFVDEAVLTGESAPVEKTASSPLFLGTSVASGIARAIVTQTGRSTKYSQIVERVRFRTPETAFELGIRKFGYFLFEVTAFIVIVIFALNIYLHKPMIDSLLFSLALAVGLTPQLLPAIISVNLSHGARRMAKERVIVKRLASLENFGQMNVLCSDKTGTVTTGQIDLNRAVNMKGEESDKTALYGYLNAHFQAGYSNPLDKAILQKFSFETSTWKKLDEIPYDFIRKRVAVFLENSGKKTLIAKGAVPQILAICDKVELPSGMTAPLNEYQDLIHQWFQITSEKGYRTLAVAYGETEEESKLTFLGFLHFLDPLKPGIHEAIEELKKKGIHFKIITGDNRLVAGFIASSLGMNHGKPITGEELEGISDRALLKIADEKNVFAEIEPHQKERIILALRKTGHIVGFLGDGINDVAALHSADVGIAVDSGTDAAKEAADIVLLEKDLSVLRLGIEQGRITFINTLKYVYMATSANFGNMFSMAGASLFLPFLPLLPKQVLLTNFFSDLPEMALATDHVDAERVIHPVKWDLPRIKRFMLIFGLLNTMADFMTFGVLLLYFKSDALLFRSGWFVENVASAALITLAIRTRRLFFKSKPSRLVTLAAWGVTLCLPLLPFTPLGKWFEIAPLPLSFYGFLIGIVAVYFASVEITKRLFFHPQKKMH